MSIFIVIIVNVIGILLTFFLSKETYSSKKITTIISAVITVCAIILTISSSFFTRVKSMDYIESQIIYVEGDENNVEINPFEEEVITFSQLNSAIVSKNFPDTEIINNKDVEFYGTLYENCTEIAFGKHSEEVNSWLKFSFVLSEKYDFFYSKVFSNNAQTNDIYLKIYADDFLIYSTNELSAEVFPIDIIIDVSNNSILTFEISNLNSENITSIFFADSSFNKK